MFSFVWLELTKVSQAAAGRNIGDPKYLDRPRKYPKYHVRQWARDSLIRTIALLKIFEKQ